MLALIVAVFKGLPDLLRLINLLLAMINDEKQKGVGYDEAFKAVMTSVHKDLAILDAMKLEIEEAHKDPSDDAFLREFERPTP